MSRAPGWQHQHPTSYLRSTAHSELAREFFKSQTTRKQRQLCSPSMKESERRAMPPAESCTELPLALGPI